MQTESSEVLPALFGITCALVAIFAAATSKPRDVRKLPAPSRTVIALLQQGRKIRATRAYRRESSTTLPEAWSMIESTIRALDGARR